MKKPYVVLVLALAVALTAALPAVGASPAQLAEKALGLAKKADKRAKKADRKAKRAQATATAAQATATGAGSAASGAQATADSARSAAGAARSAANAATSAAGAARTSARQVHREAGQTIPGTGGFVTVATMTDVAPGAYVIMGKTDVFDTGGGSVNGIVQCRVSGGGDSDVAQTFIGSGAGDFEDTLQANTVHTFTTTGTIVLDCDNNMPGTATVTAQKSKIIAIKVGEITGNAAVTG